MRQRVWHRGNRLSKVKQRQDILASLKTLARTQKTFKNRKDFKGRNFIQVSVTTHTSAILTYSEWHRSICRAPNWAELNRKQAVISALFLSFPEENACRGKTRDGACMLPELTFSLEAMMFSWVWAECSWYRKRDKRLRKMHLRIFNLLSYSHCYKNKGLSCKTLTWRKGWKWLLNEIQIISLQVGKTCSCISINLFYSKLPTTGGRAWMQCILYLATAVKGTHWNVKETLLVTNVSHDQEQFQNSKYFLVLKLN